MALIGVNANELSSMCHIVIDAVFGLIETTSFRIVNVKNFMIGYSRENSQKYESLGLHYIITDEYTNYMQIMQDLIVPYAKNEFIKLLSMTDNLSELTSIPVKDGSKETNTQNGGTFSMSENQPIDATETITTPYIKVNGKNNYTITKETQHNTVNEYKTRQEMMNGNVQTIFNFIDSWMEKMIYEYNIAY